MSVDWNCSTSRQKLQYHLDGTRLGTVFPWKYLILRVNYFTGKINGKYHKRIDGCGKMWSTAHMSQPKEQRE